MVRCSARSVELPTLVLEIVRRTHLTRLQARQPPGGFGCGVAGVRHGLQQSCGWVLNGLALPAKTQAEREETGTATALARDSVSNL